MRKDSAARTIGNLLKWSPRCREHFFPWRAKAANALRAQSIAEAGITECHPGYHLERSAPRFHLLVYPVEGAGEVYDRARSLTLAPGQFLIAPALKAFGYLPKSETWRFMWFHLPDDDTWSFLRKESLAIRGTVLAGPLHEATEGFLRESRGRRDTNQRATELLVELVATYIHRDLGAGTGSRDHDVETENRLYHLGGLINADLARDWTVEDLAGTLCVSSSHLHRMVQDHFGTSPMKMVTRLRMERAQELLILHDATQGVIGKMVGYKNEFAFLVAFKRFSGVTPGEFRKRR